MSLNVKSHPAFVNHSRHLSHTVDAALETIDHYVMRLSVLAAHVNLNTTQTKALVLRALGHPLPPRPLHYSDDRPRSFRQPRDLTPAEVRKCLKLWHKLKGERLTRSALKASAPQVPDGTDLPK